MIFAHTSVLLHESVDGLAVKPDGIYVDCTCGGGGHSSEILKLLGDKGRLICIDKDEEALAVCKQRLVSPKVSFFHSDFKQIDEVLNQAGVAKVDGILADLGVSSYQIDNPERGFSYMHGEAPLDMRMDETQSLSAFTVVNTYDERELFTLIRDYGEEKFAHAIDSPRQTHCHLRRVGGGDRKVYPLRGKENGRTSCQTYLPSVTHRSKPRTDRFERVYLLGCRQTKPVGAHSRNYIPQFGRQDCQTRICRPCNRLYLSSGIARAKGVAVTKKPTLPSEEEQENNSRSKSAKLRIFQKS